MPATLQGTYVELEDLKDYLAAQYGRKMDGAKIADHAKFGDHIPGRVEMAVSEPSGAFFGGGTVVLVPKSSIAPYIAAQYRRRFNGPAIARHKWFLRNCPTFVFTQTA